MHTENDRQSTRDTALILLLALFLALTGCARVDRDSDSNALDQDALKAATQGYLVNHIGLASFGGQVYCTSHALGFVQEKDTTEAYLWVLCQEYYWQNGKLAQGTGSSGPVDITLERHDGGYRVTGHRVPRDGSLYGDDVRTIFPLSIQREILSADAAEYNQRARALQHEVERQARLHMPTAVPSPTTVPALTVTLPPTPKPTRTPSPTQTPTILPTATQPLTPTPFPKVDLPIGVLAFITYDRQLLVRDPAGEICVLAEDGIANSPAWSPDGTRLAFSYQADDKAAAELRIYDLRTGEQTTAWTDPDTGPPYADPIREIAWSPSGRYLTFKQGCCPLGPVSIWDLEAVALAGYRGAYRMFWKPYEDVLTLSIRQPVGEFIPIGSGDSTSIALARPYEISPTVVLTGTAEILYDPRSWLSSDELVYMRLDLGDKERETERTWWTARIVDGEAVDHQQLDAPPLRYDHNPLQEHLLPWLPAVTVGDYGWSADGGWVIFSANQDRDDPWRIYAFRWEEEELIGPFAEGFDLALAPLRTSWRCPE